jgi:hypothetical protein
MIRCLLVVGCTCLLAATAAFATAAFATDERPAAKDQPAGKRLRAEQMEPRVRPRDDAAPKGQAEAASLGVSIGPVPEELRAHVELPEHCGLVITRVAPGGPAEKAGLLPHDILLEFNGRGVASPLELTEMIDAAGVGARVRLGILRRGKNREITAVLGPRAAGADGDAAAAQRPGAPAGQGLDAAARAALAQSLAMAQGGGTSVQVRSTVVNGVAEHSAVSRDRDGTIEINARAGRKTVSIRGADGTEIHAGPLDTKADLEAVPAAWRERVRALDGRIAPPATPRLPIGGS